jgi:hypothetical protein
MTGIKLVPTRLGRKILARIERSDIENESVFSKKIRKKFDDSRLKHKLKEAYEKSKPGNKHLPNTFQHPKASSIVIYDENSKEIYKANGKIRKKVLIKICSKHPKAKVLVDLGNGLYKKIPIKSFKKLIKIKFMQFERDYEFFGLDEFSRESMNGIWVTPPEAVTDNIHSINQMLRVFVIEESFDKANDVYLSARFYHLTGVDKVCKILYYSGAVEEVKYVDFLKKYNLDITMDFFGK